MQIEIIKGDITTLEVDAIVNAANTSLLGGGGVDGAIHRRGGSAILEECKEIRKRQGGCEVGMAVITNAGKLPAKKVIHTVGPIWNNGNDGEAEKLASCYREGLKLAEENNLKTVAFPNISTGVYGYPKLTAAKVALKAVKEWEGNKIEKVIFVCYDEENLFVYKRLIKG